MSKIRVAIVGCGNISDIHNIAWRRIPYVEVAAVCDTNKAAVERFAGKWNITRSFTSTSDLSDFGEVTLWDICTPIQTHANLAKQAMNSGCDVLMEKPLALTSKEAKEIVECQESTGKKAAVIHNWLFEPPILEARRIVERGEIGEILSAHIDVLATKYEQMFADKNHWVHKLPGGRFTEMLIHPIYLLQNFLGDIEAKDVAVSKLGEYPWAKYDELQVTFSAGKKLAGLYSSLNAPRDAKYITLFGRKGILKLDIINATINVLPSAKISRIRKGTDSLRQALQLTSSTLKNTFKILSGRWLDGHKMCIHLFAESLVNKTKSPVTLKEAYAAVRVMEDVYKVVESR
jgi:predicted dehydrogenase